MEKKKKIHLVLREGEITLSLRADFVKFGFLSKICFLKLYFAFGLCQKSWILAWILSLPAIIVLF